ncbi:MAG: hypothetical protein COZ06_19465 [Armatimonadetes bacterium CG_4_10_14_3_um_filter_66_18]|nr:MAG: hypothetical protein COZ06_19465 [Armatimonadetes bacterium CG_4_10_14_3_um_filter_66_18]
MHGNPDLIPGRLDGAGELAGGHPVRCQTHQRKPLRQVHLNVLDTTYQDKCAPDALGACRRRQIAEGYGERFRL